MKMTNFTNHMIHLSHAPQCIIQKRNVHFCSEWCILGYGTGALWDLWIMKIHDRRSISWCWMTFLLLDHGVLIWQTWWRHQMETFSALLALCAGNSPFPVNSPHKGQWRGALMFSLICARINDWVNNREAGELRRHRGHCDVNAMFTYSPDNMWETK